MQCPSCRNSRLSPVKLEDELPAMGCGKCGGALISLLYYRHWAEQHSSGTKSLVQEGVVVSTASDSSVSLTCPKCSKLMTKFLLSSGHSNRIDLCKSCDEAWLDGGEWELLKALQLELELPNVFGEKWQIRIRKEQLDSMKYDRLVQAVGEADAEKACGVKEWLKDNKNKATIFQYIRSS